MAEPKGFHRSCRLTETDEFSSVFVFKCMVRGKFLQVFARPNGLQRARLGVVVSKKTARHAVARNYMKRVVREVFRQYRVDIFNQDVVVRVHTLFEKKDFFSVKEELVKLFGGLKKCLER